MVVIRSTIPLAAQVLDGSTSDEYRRTVTALERYRVLASEDDGEILPATDRPVEAGGHYAGTPRLIRLLSRTGDLSPEPASAGSDKYDPALVAAVKRFQTRHGLEPDGRLGKGTLAQLNTPLSFRVRQLELAVERWRRFPYDPSRPSIALNLPEFRLRAFNPARQPALEMKIVIGRARKLKTPLLSSQVDAVIFRPHWNVPNSIQRTELIGDIKRDPTYLSKNDFELVTANNTVVTEDAVANTMLAQLRSGKLRLRQKPGAKNALGLVKFVFPNEYAVYMHDTPSKSLFAKARRDLSHGCIRLEKATDLAEWVLAMESGWSRDRVQAAMQGTETLSVRLKHTIPLATMYVTAVVMESGEVRFFEDIYGEDAALEKELNSGAKPQATSGEPDPRPHE